MANTRDIKRRIASVHSIGHITKAMEMVAGAKLRRAQNNAIASKPYIQHLKRLAGRLQNSGVEFRDPLMRGGAGPQVYIVIAADRGLSGAYNANVLRLAQEVVVASEGSVYAIGRKAEKFFRKYDSNIVGLYCLADENPTFTDAINIINPLLEEFRIGNIGSLHLVYTEFISPLNVKPTSVQLLPMLAEEDGAESISYLFEPSPQEVLGQLLLHYVYSIVYYGLLESKASEFAAQRMAMKAATDNANEMIDELTLSFNRARQTAITQEILEVVNGAQALEG